MRENLKTKNIHMPILLWGLAKTHTPITRQPSLGKNLRLEKPNTKTPALEMPGLDSGLEVPVLSCVCSSSSNQPVLECQDRPVLECQDRRWAQGLKKRLHLSVLCTLRRHCYHLFWGQGRPQTKVSTFRRYAKKGCTFRRYAPCGATATMSFFCPSYSKASDTSWSVSLVKP